MQNARAILSPEGIMLRHGLAAALALVIFAGMAPGAEAEPGDYSLLRTYYNLLHPDLPDDPVSLAEESGPYPLGPPVPGFPYGFVPDLYETWQQVDVPPETGASCGNGTPYKFFVYRVPDTNNTLFYFEGGGACWDYPSCTGQEGIRGARNVDGIPDGYVTNPSLSDFDTLSTGGVSPLIYTFHPYQRFKTGEWNMVYVPYCTGDIYIGDKVAVYQDPSGIEPDVVWNHNGLRNVQSVVSWVKNNLKTPTQLAVAGCSAGSVGALLNYTKLRGHFDSPYGYLVDDSGPMFDAPLDSNDTQAYPSLPLHHRVLESWTTYGDGGTDNPVSEMAAITPGFDPNRLASIYQGLSSKFPADRMGMTYFLADGNFSSYSYERFYPLIQNASTDELKLRRLRKMWQYDTANNLLPLLDATPNWSYHLPMYRDFNESHCTTILDFGFTDIAELGGVNVADFLNNVINYQGGAPLRSVETDAVSDFIYNHSWFYDLIDQLLGN